MSDKLCINCKWCHHQWKDNPQYAHCRNPKNMKTDLVTGKEILEYPYCSIHRGNPTVGCTSKGKWFEPKD